MIRSSWPSPSLSKTLAALNSSSNLSSASSARRRFAQPLHSAVSSGSFAKLLALGFPHEAQGSTFSCFGGFTSRGVMWAPELFLEWPKLLLPFLAVSFAFLLILQGTILLLPSGTTLPW